MINSCENNRLIKLNGLKILCIADTHRRLNEDELSIIENYRNSVDLILTLGDIPMDSLNKINEQYKYDIDRIKKKLIQKPIYFIVNEFIYYL